MPSLPLLTLRNATLRDSEILLAWRNDPRTVAASLNQAPVDRKSHERWLSASLLNTTRELLIAELDGHPVGSVRIDNSRDLAELSWTVAPEWRGQGVGKTLILAAVRHASVTNDTIVARIREDNVASQKIAEVGGLVCTHRERGVTHWSNKKG